MLKLNSTGKKFLVFVVLLIGDLMGLSAQQTVYFKSYTTQEGLPAGTITGLWDDPKGFLWLLSENGLSRFDGNEFIEYRNNPSDPSSLPSSTVISGHSDNAGNTFFITSRAIASYSYKTENFKALIPLSSAKEVRWIKFFRQFTFFLMDGVFYKADFSKNTVTKHNIPAFISDAPIINAEMYGNQLLFVTRNGFSGFDLSTNQFKKLDHIGLKSDSTFSLLSQPNYFFTKENKLYLSCLSRLFEFETKNQIFKEVLPRSSETARLRSKTNFEKLIDNYLIIPSANGEIEFHNLITGKSGKSSILKKLKEDRGDYFMFSGFVKGKNNNFWLQNNNGGLIEFAILNDSLRLLSHLHTGNSDNPTNDCNLILDYSNKITWYFSAGEGLVKCERNKALFNSFVTDGKSIPNNYSLSRNIRSICETQKNSLFIATLDGVRQFNLIDNSLTVITQPTTGKILFNETSFSTIIRDQNDNIWISGWNTPILHRLNYKKNEYTSYVSSDSIQQNDRFTYRSAFLDSDSFIYFGLSSGQLFRIHSNAGNHPPEKLLLKRGNELIKGASIFCITRYINNQLLLGTAKGVFIVDKNTLEVFPVNNHLPLLSSDIRSIIFHNESSIWIGTNGNGLLHYNSINKTIRQFRKEEGLSDNSVYSLLMDASANIWMGTNKGICKFTPEKNSILTFSNKDGLLFEEFNTNAACNLSDGRLAFGGINGFIIFHPDTVSANLPATPPVLTKILANNKIQPLDTIFNFHYDENNLTFQFSALDFFRNEEIQYAYKMEGLDKNWIHCGTRRFTTYANLDPGDYVFKVKRSNPHGEWSEKELSIPFTISTPWYKSAYFFILLLLSLAGLIYSWLLYKNRQNRKLLTIRENIARDLHDEIGSNLSSISIFNQVAKESISRKKDDVIPVLDKIGEYTQISQEAMNDIVWMIDSKNDRFENILVKMRTLAAETIGSTAVHLHLNLDERLKNVKIEMKQRKNLYLIFKESLNNILKYAHCNNVWIDLFENDKMITLLIKDDGKGFKLEETKGNGLVNMKKRAMEIKGVLIIESFPEKGTSVKLVFDL
ncbi:MAG: hypothetical protein IPN36_10975 [Bacteroidetes bacterium]|nr:hypothetical protein [Bacteroidota bacterium]